MVNRRTEENLCWSSEIMLIDAEAKEMKFDTRRLKISSRLNTSSSDPLSQPNVFLLLVFAHVIQFHPPNYIPLTCVVPTGHDVRRLVKE